MSETVQVVAVAFALRWLQALLEMAPTLLGGIILAALLRELVGPASTRRFFANSRWPAPVSGLAWGMMVPVCSLGVLPIARELFRARVAPAAVFSFVFAAPMLNFLALAYMLTALPADRTLVLSVTLAGVALTGGLLAGRYIPTGEPAGETRETGRASGRLGRVFRTAARIMAGTSLFDVGVALTIGAFIAAITPPDVVPDGMGRDHFWAAPFMMLVSAPAYIAPPHGVSMLGSMNSVGNSLAAGLSLIVFGVGLNLALGIWIIRSAGFRYATAFLTAAVVIVLIAGTTANVTFPSHAGPDEHTHALDDLGRPLYLDHRVPIGGWFRHRVVERADNTCFGALAVLVLLTVIGLVIRDAPEPAASSVAADEPAPTFWDRRIPSGVVGALVALVPIAISSTMLYIYFPSPSELFEEMRIARTEVISAVNSGDMKLADEKLPVWQTLAGKLPYAAALRWDWSPEARQSANDLKSQLQRLHDALHHRDERIKEIARAAYQAHDQCRRIYIDSQLPRNQSPNG